MSAPPHAANPDGALGGGGTQHADNENNDVAMADSDSTPQASLRDKERESKDGKKRRFFGLGKRKESSEKTPTKSSIGGAASPTNATTSGTAAANARSPTTTAAGATSPPLEIPRPAPRSPPQAGQPSLSAAAASPARSSRYRSASPQLHSPASSMIFERNVQEGAPIPDDASVHIPTHITTEDHIPPVLEASSLAITDDHLGPDEVEIVMHAAHQPAAEKVVGGGGGGIGSGGGSMGSDTGAISPIQGLSPVEDFGVNLHKSLESTQAAVANQFPSPSLPQSPSLVQQQQGGSGGDDGASSYGAIDTADVRRLSFISFADVVQSEHVESGRDSVLHMSISNSTTAATNRSPSPVRSPVGTSPPTSGAPSMKGLDIGAAAASSQKSGARGPGSPTSGGVPHSPTTAPGGGGGGGGEIVVETMRQALKKTGSGDVVPKSALDSHASGDESVFR